MVLAGGIVVPQGFTKLMSMVAWREGASPVNVPVSELVRAVTRVEVVQPGTAPIVPDAAEPANSDLARLSERERLILRYLTAGASNKQIARDLDVAEATVKAHVKSLLRKLRVNNRTQAAMWAISRATCDERADTPDGTHRLTTPFSEPSQVVSARDLSASARAASRTPGRAV
jgi:two-component system nitrate/nitrite response regulator NarL